MPATICPICVPTDVGELRRELGEIFTRDYLMPSVFERACRLIRQLARSTGLSEAEIIETANGDAECLLLEAEA